MELKNLSSNWKKLQVTLKNEKNQERHPDPVASTPAPRGVKRKQAAPFTKLEPTLSISARKRKKMEVNNSTGLVADSAPTIRPADKINEGLSPTAELGKYIAIDCEMVGVGPNPDRESALARVSAVSYNGDQVYDSYVKPKESVTDWRTHVSGILPKHMVGARSLEDAQRDIANILKGKILVGHAIRNDLEALMLSHPKRDIRDTARHPPFRKFAGGGSPRLKILAAELLGLDIQGGEHSSIEDARATMMLFRRDKDGFEREHAINWPAPKSIPDSSNSANRNKKKKKKKKS